MYICIDLGGTNIRGTWIDEHGNSGDMIYLTRPADLNGTKETLLSLVESLSKNAPKRVRGLGLATAGPLDHRKKYYLETSNMPELNYFNVGNFFKKNFNLPLIMENDAQAAALGEVWRGGLAGENNALILTLGTGVGSGVILNGRIWRAAHFTGPELGHIYLGCSSNKYCGCGQNGCAEVNLNKAALEELFNQNGFSLIGLKEIYAEVKKDNKQTQNVMQAYAQRLGLYLSILQVVFGMPNIGISGGMSAFFPFWQDYIWGVLYKRLAKRKSWLPKRIVSSPDPEMSALYGMARAWLLKEKSG